MTRSAVTVAILTAALVHPAIGRARGLDYWIPSGWTAETQHDETNPGEIEGLVLHDPDGRERIRVVILSNPSGFERTGYSPVKGGLEKASCESAGHEMVEVAGGTGIAETVLCSSDDHDEVLETVRAHVGGATLHIRFVSPSPDDHEVDQATFRGFLRRMDVLAI